MQRPLDVVRTLQTPDQRCGGNSYQYNGSIQCISYKPFCTHPSTDIQLMLSQLRDNAWRRWPVIEPTCAVRWVLKQTGWVDMLAAILDESYMNDVS